jgi:hypothetical protein
MSSGRPIACSRSSRRSALPRDHALGTFPPRDGVATVEICAIALAMAGGRPEYLPVLMAAVDAFLDPDSGSSPKRRGM